MNDTQQILKAIQDVEKRLDEKLDQKLEPIKNQLDSQGKQLNSQGKKLDNLTSEVATQGKTLEAHGKILESHSKQLTSLAEGQKNLTGEVSHLKTASEAIIAGLAEVTKAVKSDKEIKIRLKNLEEHTGTDNPIKN